MQIKEIENYLSTLLAIHRLPGMGPVKLKEILTSLQTEVQSQDNIKDIFFSKDDNCKLFPGKADWKGVEKDLEWAQKQNHSIVTFYDDAYPKILKEIHSAPPILFVAGDLTLLSLPQLAMVGSRNPTAVGRETACFFAQKFSEQGLCVTSGLAIGIDGASHRGALHISGKTIAVLAGGLDKIYPPAHQKLALKIAERGALVSEFPIGVSPVASHFPRRNRIISGLSLGTLVIEATLKSGSLITAKYALDQGREVFAIPGSIYSSQAQGCHALIRQGAKLVETPQDVLEEMGSLLNYLSGSTELNRLECEIGIKSKASAPMNALGMVTLDEVVERELLYHIGFEPTSIDTLVARSGLTIAEVSSILLELELKGWIQGSQGGYSRSRARDQSLL